MVVFIYWGNPLLVSRTLAYYNVQNHNTVGMVKVQWRTEILMEKELNFE
jgi:hypothetical protein